MRNRPAFETQAEKLDRTRRKLAPGDARGTFRAASPVDGNGRGGGDVTIINQGGGAVIEHVTLTATAGQTIAAGGAGVEWADTAGAPTEQRGFRSLTLPVVAIPINVAGFLLVGCELEFASTVDATFQVTRTRLGVDEDFVNITDTDVDGVTGHKGGWVKPGDTVTMTLTPSADVDVSGSCELEIWTLASATSDPAITYESVVLADGPLGYWRLDETSGTTAADSSGNGYDMTYSGGPTLGMTGVMKDGTGATAVGFDGSDDFVDGADWSAFDFAGTDPYTLECWFAVGTVTSAESRILIQKQTASSAGPAVGWELVVGTNGKVVHQRDGGAGVSSPAAVTAGEDIHAVVTFDGITLRLYLDGAEVASTTSVGTVTANTVTLSFADDSAESSPAFHLAGRMDEVAIYGRALTADQVARHYAVGRLGA